MSNKEDIDALCDTLKEVAKYQTANLVSRSDWGKQNFKEIESTIEFVISLAKILKSLPLHHIPSPYVHNMKSYYESIRKTLDEIDSFDVEKNDLNQKQSICNNINQQVNSLKDGCHSWIAFVNFLNQDSQEEVKKLKKIVSETEGLQTKSEASLNQLLAQAEKLLEDMKTASAKVGVGTFTKEFDDEAMKLQTQSRWWLLVTIGMGVFTVATSVYFFWQSKNISPDSVSLTFINFVVAKVSIIAILFAATLWCGRVYKSLVHLTTVNKHRALSLQTFQAFVNAAGTERVRDSVLIAATNCVFANVPTGFIDSKHTPSEQAIQFMEIGKQTSGES